MSELQKDIETEHSMMQMSQSHMADFEAQLENLSERARELEEKIVELEEAQKENREKFAEGEKNLAHLNAERAKVEEGGFEFERKLNEVNSKMREKMTIK